MFLKSRDARFRREISPHSHARVRSAGTMALLLASVAISAAGAGDLTPAVATPSSWVTPRTFDKYPRAEGLDPSIETRWLLVDHQINARNDEQFYHFARQILTSSGVMRFSHITVEYDPSCEALTFHWVRLWRGGECFNRLDRSKIQTSQGGLNTESFLFSSQQSATLLLEDVRVGDIIEYAYTIEGSNPALDGKFVADIPLQFAEPVDSLYTRLVWPHPRLLYIQNHGTDFQPRTLYKSNLVEFIWSLQKVAPLRREPPTPIWYDPWPWVQLSEFHLWSDVNKWALRLFSTTNAPEPELANKIKEWKALPEAEDRLLAALRFVQEDVRYLAVEGGSAGYQPASASAVFARRYGDCKDKTLLLVSILRALKIEAYPVLVNSRRRQTLADMHPSPILFDHAITAATLNEQTYWLDATAMYERGPLAVRSWPNYGRGLLIRPGVDALTEIPPCPVQPKTTVVEHVHVRGLNSETSMRIVTEAEGSDAEGLRQHFATTPREDLEREYLNDQAKLYPDIRPTGPLLFTDDEQQNRIEIVESYAIQKIWGRLADETTYHCHFYSVNVDGVMRKPAVSVRTMPLAVPFPVHQVFRLEATLDSILPVIPENQTIENRTFYFHRSVRNEGARIRIEHEYRTWTDGVAPEAVPAYLRQLDSATDLLDYTLISY